MERNVTLLASGISTYAKTKKNSVIGALHGI